MNSPSTNYELKNGTNITIRPIRPEDAELEQRFIRALSPQSRYSRFMSGVNELTPNQLHHFTHNHFPNEMALIATHNENETEVQLGVARYVLSEKDHSAEFAVVVADQWQGRGIATLLLRNLTHYASLAGVRNIKGFMLKSNRNMYTLAKELGLKIESIDKEPKLYQLSGDLRL